MSDTRIRVLSLNCWGLKYVAKNRKERIAAIAFELSKSDYDIVALQEIWVAADYALVRESVAKILPYAKYFYSGALGAGLALLSRFPIIAATVQPYSLNGSPLDVAGGDWFVGKAATSIVVAHPILGQLQVFNTHLFAKGGESGPEHHRAHRLVNAWEFSKLALQSAEMGRYVICLGDFNSVPTTLPMTIIRDHAGLTDGWFASHPELAQDPPEHTPDAASALHLFGVTADSPLNSYSAGKWLDDHARQFAGKRLDYVLYRQPAPSARGHARSDSVGGNGRAPALRCIQSAVVFTENVPRRSFSYSDHFGLEATFEVVANAGKRSSAAPPSPWAEDIEGGTGDGADSVSLADVPSDEVLPPSYLTHASLATVIEALTTCYKLSQARSRKYLWLFGGSILLLLGMIVGSAWLPRSWANPVFILLAVAVAWFGTTMLYVGFIYGRWEVNALLNVIEELEIHRSTIVR